MTISDVATDVRKYMLRRQDMQTELEDYADHFVKVLCQRIPFEEMRSIQTVTCTAGNPILALDAMIGTDLAGIVSMQIQYSPTSMLRLKRNDVRNFDSSPLPMPGKPTQYARYGLQCELWPPPDQPYPIKVRWWKHHEFGDPFTTVLRVPESWHDLIRYEVYYRALVSLGRSDEAQFLVIGTYQPKMPGQAKKQWMTDMGIIPRLWNDLLTTISQRENIDEDFGINPVRG